MPNQTSDFYPRPLRHLSSYLSGLVQGKLWLKVLIGMFLGLITGTLLGPSVGLVEPETGTLIGNWLAFPGWFAGSPPAKTLNSCESWA